MRAAKVTRTALISWAAVFASHDFTDSRLYAADHRHILRPGKKGTNTGGQTPVGQPHVAAIGSVPQAGSSIWTFTEPAGGALGELEGLQAVA